MLPTGTLLGQWCCRRPLREKCQIAKNVGKLQPQVIRKDEKGMTIKNDYLARLLKRQTVPGNVNIYDFLYRIASDLVYTSNSFSVIFYNEDFTRVTSIQPITTKSYRIFEDEHRNILFRFRPGL